MNKDNPLVYSTESGKIRQEAEPDRRQKSGGSGTLYIRREVKGRRGKTVTTISGLEDNPAAMLSLAADLKKLCGTGGTVKDEQIIIQGDLRQRIADFLKEKGYNIKFSGG
ncbi:MAG: stress response translation initiation inhibitor YciH [Calditrichaeota bacterium]|nr:MAG: stress response translation initiation inhibitor YciH [Calditrichota bacterium]